jgi:hypothetical protein
MIRAGRTPRGLGRVPALGLAGPEGERPPMPVTLSVAS